MVDDIIFFKILTKGQCVISLISGYIAIRHFAPGGLRIVVHLHIKLDRHAMQVSEVISDFSLIASLCIGGVIVDTDRPSYWTMN